MTVYTWKQFAEASDVSRETIEKLEAYAALLVRWNKKINLVSPKTLDELWTRHFLDSAQLAEILPLERRWVDLGSGAGFPGLVLALLAPPAAEFILVESDQRKATFLRTVARELGVAVTIRADRIEALPGLEADVLTSRALAPLTVLLGYAEQHLKPGGKALFPKGATAETEIAEALENWRFCCKKHASRTDASSTILCIGDIERV